MEQTKPKKTIIGPVVGSVVAVIVAVLVQQFFFKAPTYDETMMKAASEINKSCPLMVDQDTRLDNTLALPGKVFQYNYTLVNWLKDSVDVGALQTYMEPLIINNAKTSPDMQYHRDHRATLAYHYKDKHGEFVVKLLIKPEQYAE
jgi:hypothetical protein